MIGEIMKTLTDELLEMAETQAEMTVAIIDMFIDYNKLLKKTIAQLQTNQLKAKGEGS